MLTLLNKTNMSILQNIITTKKKELATLMPQTPVSEFSNRGFFWHSDRRSLITSLTQKNNTGIIAEFKRKSPSRGWIHKGNVEPHEVVPAYDTAAAGISILTDYEFFGGSLDDLMAARLVTTKPLLRKDFIVDTWQIAEARAFGADVILLIAACLSPAQVKELAAAAVEYGIEVILELHDESEIGHICDNTIMIGINNRNLNTFEVDSNQSIRMASFVPSGKILIAESGIRTPDDIHIFQENGFSGFLAGEVFMKAEDPGKAFLSFVEALNSKYEN
jgi:indole-3-glycerol phosphate synthase